MTTSDHLFPLDSDQIKVTSDDCYTPRWVFDAMGLQFDLDVAAPPGGPWHVPAARYFTAEDDGLAQPWDGLVWCNPPYSNFRPWAERWAVHDCGVLMGMTSARSMGRAIGLRNADAVAVIDVQFERQDMPLRDVPTAIFVAFRGVGIEPAKRLAAADPRGTVLYGEGDDAHRLCRSLVCDPETERPVDLRHCDGCGEDYNAFKESHVGHCPCGHDEHQHDLEANPELCMVCGDGDSCDFPPAEGDR